MRSISTSLVYWAIERCKASSWISIANGDPLISALKPCPNSLLPLIRFIRFYHPFDRLLAALSSRFLIKEENSFFFQVNFVDLLSNERMGISKVMGCVSTVLFSASIYLKKSGRTYTPAPLLFGALIGFTISIASHPAINATSILGKSSSGTFPLWSKFLFGPYLVSVRLYVVLKRMMRRESLYDEICEGLYVGGWPTSRSRLPPGYPAVIDCTCELPRSYFIPSQAYLCIPLWDTRSPSPEQIEFAVGWACKKRSEKKPIYIHCANGHGRSVCVMCALLVELGEAASWKDAEKMILEKRPFIRMNFYHRKNLEEWSKRRSL